MLLDFELFDSILPAAEASPRGRMNFDLRTQAGERTDHLPYKQGVAWPGAGAASGASASSPQGSDWRDMSQRMLNVLTPGTEIPIHRHNETSETVIVLRGAVEEIFFDSEGRITERFELRYGGPRPGIQVPRGVYHTCRCLEPGSVIFEAKDRPYDTERTEDLLGK